MINAPDRWDLSLEVGNGVIDGPTPAPSSA